MYFLKLIKGKTYWGIVKASQDKPLVCVPEKEQADMLVKSGFFILVEEPEKGAPDNSVPVEEVEDVCEELFASDDEPLEQEDGSGLIELQQKTKSELSEYAEMNGIDLTGCKTKDDMISKIVEAMARATIARQAIRNSDEV